MRFSDNGSHGTNSSCGTKEGDNRRFSRIKTTAAINVSGVLFGVLCFVNCGSSEASVYCLVNSAANELMKTHTETQIVGQV